MEPKRLDHIMVLRHPYYSRTQMKKLIEDGFVKINGEVKTKPSLILKGGEEIELVRRGPEIPKATPENIPLNILYEDDDLIVINKAAGMVVHPAPGHFHGTLVHALLHHFGAPLPILNELEVNTMDAGVSVEDSEDEEELREDAEDSETLDYPPDETFRPGIVHRLDKGTSGVMVSSKNDWIHHRLSNQFRDHTVEKIYETLVFGKLTPKKATISQAIGRDTQHRRKFSSKTNKSREAVTHYEVVKQYENIAHVRVKIDTGRTHQIRVHLSEKNHPILGDTLYGAKSFISMIKDEVLHQKIEEGTRPILHAKKLSFTHPRTQERMTYETNLPEDFLEIIHHLENLENLK
ncbi:MAG: RluA family pseudouridine synthase [Deltaproteobacteria bacterium]|nr:MAG: RluA family pseudouridine synthase [Deltaproteobacteria bacterium]